MDANFIEDAFWSKHIRLGLVLTQRSQMIATVMPVRNHFRVTILDFDGSNQEPYEIDVANADHALMLAELHSINRKLMRQKMPKYGENRQKVPDAEAVQQKLNPSADEDCRWKLEI